MPKSNDGITEVTSSGSSPSGGLTDIQLRASDVKVSLDGEVVPVTGSFFQATQPVSLASDVNIVGSQLDDINTVQQNGGQKTQVVDGSGNAIPSSSIIPSAVARGLVVRFPNDANLALEDGNILQIAINTSLIAAKDFATQATLALIKAKTDNIDVAISTRTKPADQQHVIVDTMPSASSSTVADVLDVDDNSNYIAGDLAKNITQTPDGRLRAVVAGLVSDVRQSFIDGEIRSLSLTSDGRLRVATSESFSYLEMFEAENSFFFDIPQMSSEESGRIDMDNNPWGI